MAEAMAAGKLCISVIEARNVMADTVADPNFYVKLKLGSSEVKTDTVRGTDTPKFLKDIRMGVPNPESDTLRIELLQVGPKGDLIVGCDELRLLSITSKGTIVHWFELRTARDVVGAELCLVLRFLTAGANRPMTPSYAIAARQAKERAMDDEAVAALTSGPAARVQLFSDSPFSRGFVSSPFAPASHPPPPPQPAYRPSLPQPPSVAAAPSPPVSRGSSSGRNLNTPSDPGDGDFRLNPDPYAALTPAALPAAFAAAPAPPQQAYASPPAEVASAHAAVAAPATVSSSTLQAEQQTQSTGKQAAQQLGRTFKQVQEKLAVPLPVAVLSGLLAGAVAFILRQRPLVIEEDDTLCSVGHCFNQRRLERFHRNIEMLGSR